MLKIKDNVDLKELEKFGFVKNEYVNEINVNDWYKTKWVNDNGDYIEPPELDRNEINWITYEAKDHSDFSMINVIDNTEEKEFLPRQILEDDFNIEILYDLIKADLVEKVEK